MRAAPTRDLPSRRSSIVRPQLLEVLFEELPDAVVLVDENGVIVHANRQTELLFGYDRDKMLGEPVEFLLPDVHQEIRSLLREDGRPVSGTRQLEVTSLRNEGWTVSVAVRLKDLRFGEERLVMASVRDISDHQTIEENRLLATLSLVLSEAVDLQAGLAAVLHEILDETGWAYGEALVSNADGLGLQVVAFVHGGEPAVAAFGEASKRAAVPTSSIPGLVLTSQRPSWVDDLANETRFIRRQEAAEAGLRGAVFVPVLSLSEPVVVFGFYADHSPRHDGPAPILAAAATRLGPLVARKLFDDELRDRELKLADAQALAHMGSWEWDIAANHIAWSEEMYRIFGLEPASEISYGTFLERIHPEDRDMVDWMIHDAFRSQEPFSSDYRIVCPDGSIRIIHAEGRLILDQAGLPARMMGTGQDVTERKRSEDALRASEERLRSTLETANDAFVAIDSDGVITRWNRQAEATFGWSRKDAVGRRLVDTIIPPTYREAHLRGLSHFLETGEGPVLNQRTELVAQHKDGTEFPVELTIWAQRDDAGLSFSAFIRDVTEQRSAEERLARQAALLDMANDAILVRDFGGVIRFWNQGAEELYGWSVDEALGRISHELLKTVPEGATLEEIEDAVLRDGRWDGELVHTCRDGRRIVVASRWALQPDGSRVPPSALEINTDISERKRAEEAIRQRTEDLERSNSDLVEFAYVASHDLQEPLRMVSSYVQLLAERYDGRLDDDADEFISFAVDGARRMQALIEDILAYSRAGTSEISRVPVDTSELVAAIVSLLHPPVEETGASIEVGPLPVVNADATQLGQVFQNLLSNAIKFTAPGVAPGIDVTATRDRAGWRFTVADNGIGVEDRFVQRIFRPFKRLHGRDEYPGSGLGLSVCKRAVERRGGRIWVEQAPGGGSAFNFTVPDVVEADADD